MREFSNSLGGAEFSRIADRIVKYYDKPMVESAEMLQVSTVKFFNDFLQSSSQML